MTIVGGYLVACLGLVILGVAGDIRPFALVVYALALAIVAGLLAGFNVYRGRSLRAIMGRIKGAAPVVPTGIVEAPTEKVAGILRELRGVRGEVVTIDRGAAAINGRADRAIDLARGIKGFFVGVRSSVHKIDAHTNSIDCATLLNIVGRTTGCNQ